nr:MAG TPA: helix-turn-helix domain protein [Caudoviricetes sp.]
MAKNAIETQKEAVLAYMKEHGAITSWTAIELFGATRLSAIIFKLRREGHEIKTQMRVALNRYGHTVNFAQYVLIRGKK